jgi:hypothetical protein
MGIVRSPKPVNLFCGIISNDPDLMDRAVRMLCEYAGPTDAVSELWPFDSTEYYELEMGEDLRRKFVSFEKWIDPGDLAHQKILSNELERRICYELGYPPDQRRVNLDPGYLSLSKIVLATTKDYSHRLYLRDGIYAESTLHFESGKWIPWPWTYPDFADARYHGFFTQVRELFKIKLNTREQNGGSPPAAGSREGRTS